jgi:hypothetical protein
MRRITGDPLLLAAIAIMVLAMFVGLAPAAPRCHIAGDEIANGITLPQCSKKAQPKAVSGDIAAMIPTNWEGIVIISGGSNDPDNVELYLNLAAARARAPLARYIWILPHPPRAKLAVAVLSRENKVDEVVQFTAGKDKIHPASYSGLSTAIAARIK